MERDGAEVIYYLPKDTAGALPGPVGAVENLSLLLSKFAPFVQEKGTPKTSVAVLRKAGFRPEIRPEAREAYMAYFRTYREMLKTVGARTVYLTSKSRLIVGLGNESVYETSITLLRNYGVPYIPGSALKGVTKAYAIEMLAEILVSAGHCGDFFKCAGKVQEWLNGGELERFPESVKVRGTSRHVREFLRIFTGDTQGGEINLRDVAGKLVAMFGTTDREGDVVFFDALPENPNSIRLEFDIMNPHYGPYYSKGQPPGDWYDPVPVLFLTVRKGARFLFAVGRSSKAEKDLSEEALKLLKLALREHGVGAKTSLGYGRFG
ncbi:type III-B CRISPR module RAMP protein Cmr6 [Thermococcus sp. JdF3]|uniref:type III-B CRISPR module RAMP protein Cmr6 n=1 Tax=Thermococcus sp. JdF3 TaxID=1638258 RepID=UPI001439D8CC|nr:type III-B CRISPR module RAMP protein Cmr6 [Thermococcus sp. JdF3]NJE01389.1 type III-B CRISPR module RAMP protein Cmr6 [Thermococcus sp. JdF3]